MKNLFLALLMLCAPACVMAADNVVLAVSRAQSASTKTVNVVGSLKKSIEGMIAKGEFKDWKSIMSLKLSGELRKDDWKLLKEMCTSGNSKGYNLQEIDLSLVTNTKMESWMFNNCTLLRRITFPNNLEFVPSDIANGCSELLYVNIPSAKHIGHNAFSKCLKLKEIWFPKNLTYIYNYAFENIKSIQDIYLRSLPVQVERVINTDDPIDKRRFGGVFKDFQMRKARLHVPADYVDYYREPDPQHCVSMYIQDLLDSLSLDSPEWNKETPEADYKAKGALRDFFKWADDNTQIIGDVKD